MVRSPEVRVVVVGPERRDLVDRVALADRDRPELVLVHRAGEDCEEPVRAGVRGEVPVHRSAAEERVTHRAADDVRRVAVRPQALHHGVYGARDLDRWHAPMMSERPGAAPDSA